MSNDVLFYVAFYSMMGIFVSLVIVGADLGGPPLSQREVVKIVVAGALWPFFVLAGFASIMWDLFKSVRGHLVKIANDMTRYL